MDYWKNWLFSATPKGATASALVYTMVEMAKANELNIYKYLTYLLEHRPSEDMSDEQLEALTPWSKEVKNVCKNKNVVKRLYLAKMMQALIKI